MSYVCVHVFLWFLTHFLLCYLRALAHHRNHILKGRNLQFTVDFV